MLEFTDQLLNSDRQELRDYNEVIILDYLGHYWSNSVFTLSVLLTPCAAFYDFALKTDHVSGFPNKNIQHISDIIND